MASSSISIFSLLSPKPSRALSFPLAASTSDASDPDPDPAKLAFAKSDAYKKSKAEDPVKLALYRAREYKKSRSSGGGASDSGSQAIPVDNSSVSRDEVTNKKVGKRKDPNISNVDFLGLNFSDKKEGRGLPAGLATPMDTFPQGDLPEVEIIVGDSSKFKNANATTNVSDVAGDDTGLYKPKVSTWGVFPRPDNISKTYGGGRNIQPGEVLETEKVKALKESQSRQLIASYKRKIGLNIDAKTKSKCEKALKQGNDLMDLGELREAMSYYEEVMAEVVFESKLHGLAALQWSICQDSLSRSNEARIMYEKLQSHPNVEVSKKAKQFMFGFKAMEMMKISRSSSTVTGYENYFNAFVEEKPNYTASDQGKDEDSLNQIFPYVMFLLSPIAIFLLAVARKEF